MKRRDFLKASAIGGTAAAMAGMYVRRASAVPLFGDVPDQHASLMLPKANQATSILECFLYGGLAPWESFYGVPEFGSEAARTWHKAYPIDLVNAVTACGYDSGNMFTPFANDSSGRPIFFGPYVTPLLARPDVTDRLRVVVNRHTLEPHEAAIPLALAGKPLGSPTLASLGTHVAAYQVAHDVENQHPAPFAYGLSSAGSFVNTDNILTMVASGQHPGAARPLHIKVDNVARLSQLLGRTQIGSLDDRARYDALLQAYFAQYTDRLKFGGSGPQLRAPRFGELTAAGSSVAHAADIRGMISDDYLSVVPGNSCLAKGDAKQDGTGPTPPISGSLVHAALNGPYMCLRLATHLLTHPQFPAAHCCMIDLGLVKADGGGGYDTHSETPFTQSSNLFNFLNSLLPMINAPGETDPNKLDLNKTMIIINMEFGRAPGLQKAYPLTGRNHWPYGYTQIYIGGPITHAQRGIYGTIPESGQASTFTTPTENRIAALLAMGIYPFGQLSFSGSDVQGQTLEGPAIQSVTKRVLGYDV